MSLRKFVCLSAVLVFAGTAPALYPQTNDAGQALALRLADTFKITAITKDRSDIVTPGAIVALQKPGLVMYSVTDSIAPLNTYKNGKISQGWGGFGRDLLTTSLMAGNGSTNDIPKHSAVAGEKFWIVSINANKGMVSLALYSDPDSNGLRYWAELKFPFDKKSVPSIDDALKSIAEALTVDSSADQNAPSGPPPPSQPVNNADPGSSIDLHGTYVRKDHPGDSMMLGQSGVFALFQSGRAYSGHYTIAGETLTIWGPNIPGRQACRISGNVITDPQGTLWVKPSQAQNPASTFSSNTAVASPAVAPMAALPPPPPPADVPPPTPPTLSLGQTMDQVVAVMGQPKSVARIGTKTIFNFSDLKVVFVNGKVSDIQ